MIGYETPDPATRATLERLNAEVDAALSGVRRTIYGAPFGSHTKRSATEAEAWLENVRDDLNAYLRPEDGE